MLVLAVIVVGRALRLSSRQVQVAPAAPVAIDADQVAERLAEAIRFRTISNQAPAQFDATQCTGLGAMFAQRFPRVHGTLALELVNDHSRLYRWAGRGEGKPVVLLAHLDVVPIEAGTEDGWAQPP